MKRILLVMLAIALAGVSRGQAVDTYRSRTAGADSLSRAKVEIVEHGTVGQTVKTLRSATRQGDLKGYRVRIFFGNDQSARGQATEVTNQFRELFPEVPVYMTYENPYWRVAVGNCANLEEAIMLKGRIEASFSRAFIYREDFPIAKLTE